MLDAVREPARMRPEALVDVEHLIDRDVADGVGGDSPAGVVGLAAERREFVASKRSTPSGRVPVVDAQRRGRAAQAAVGEKLHRVDAQRVGHELVRQRYGLGTPSTRRSGITLTRDGRPPLASTPGIPKQRGTSRSPSTSDAE